MENMPNIKTRSKNIIKREARCYKKKDVDKDTYDVIQRFNPVTNRMN